MAEILGLGLSHYPPLCGLDKDMSGLLRWTLEDPAIPDAEKDPANWPESMRKDWSTDRGEGAAGVHRAQLVAQFDRIRKVLDDFAPDAIVMWGDDQYENFREDVIPPYTVCAYSDIEVHPWKQAHKSSAMEGNPNIWNESGDTGFTIKGRPDIARRLVAGLLEAGMDPAYAYTQLHHPSLPHAFLNAVLFLDYHRNGFDHPIIPFPINCYGRRVISCKGFMTRLDDKFDFDPPSPPPKRFMELGAATARVLKDSPWRIALVASSSWSHAFLCDKTYRMRPDTPGDERLYRALRESDYGFWRNRSLANIEDAGQHEVLNWFPLMGAMEELGASLEWSNWVGTDLFNSNKVFAIYNPA